MGRLVSCTKRPKALIVPGLVGLVAGGIGPLAQPLVLRRKLPRTAELASPTSSDESRADAQNAAAEVKSSSAPQADRLRKRPRTLCMISDSVSWRSLEKPIDEAALRLKSDNVRLRVGDQGLVSVDLGRNLDS